MRKCFPTSLRSNRQLKGALECPYSLLACVCDATGWFGFRLRQPIRVIAEWAVLKPKLREFFDGDAASSGWALSAKLHVLRGTRAAVPPGRTRAANMRTLPAAFSSRTSLIPRSLLAPTHDSLSSLGSSAAATLPKRAASRWRWSLALLSSLSVLTAWLAVRHVPWFGPLVADELRSLLGSERVTGIEETVASVEDRLQQAVSDGKARSLSDATPNELLPAVAESKSAAEDTTRRRSVGALYAATASAEDGAWQRVNARTGKSGAIYRTIVHPDSERAYAELFVFALDLSKVRVHAVAGSIEPRGSESKDIAPAPRIQRPGVIPERDRDRLIAAFNGGFKAEHGQFGMMVDGVQLLAPKPQSCTFAATSDGGLRIAPWSALVNAEPFGWWRQTPGCMLLEGELHPGLRASDSRNWGATLEGKTVIRRSAVGLSADARTLFVGISNSTTARALALGMQHVGAHDVAQLDVNFSFPRFLLYRESEGAHLDAVGAVRGLLYQRDEYLGRASTRDFFYVTAS